MQRETLFWLAVMTVGGVFLVGRAAIVGNGRQYVELVTVEADADGQPGGDVVRLTSFENVPPNQEGAPQVSLSLSRTIGIWVAAFCTIGILSFLMGDTPLYKLVESVFVGVSAAYWMVVGFWSEIVQNLLGNLSPSLMRDGTWPEFVPEAIASTYQLKVTPLLPGMEPAQEPNYWYVVPLIFSVMMLMRLSPRGGWISRWPLAFFIGATAGIRLFSYLEADFVAQINSTILPLLVMAADRTIDPWASLRNVFIVFGVLMGLVYFFFSVEHKGIVGGVARGGVWLLMITFGASFGYTVMGRIALLADRLEFLFNDWLWIIDPAGDRSPL